MLPKPEQKSMDLKETGSKDSKLPGLKSPNPKRPKSPRQNDPGVTKVIKVIKAPIPKGKKIFSRSPQRPYNKKKRYTVITKKKLRVSPGGIACDIRNMEPLLLRRRTTQKIIINGKDRTPKPLTRPQIRPEIRKWIRKRLLDLGDQTLPNAVGLKGIGSSMSLQQQMPNIKDMHASITQSFAASVFDDIPVEKNVFTPATTDLHPDHWAPSQFQLPKFPHELPPPYPNNILLSLKETPTFFLLDRPSLTEEQDTEAGRQVVQENERYAIALHCEPDEEKKVKNKEVQTVSLITKNQFAIAPRCMRRNNEVLVTTYDIYRTYKMVMKALKKKRPIGTAALITPKSSASTDESPPVKESTDSSEKTTKETINKLKLVKPSTTAPLTAKEKFVALVKTTAFQNAVVTMERILASNVYNKEQKIFKGLIQQDHFKLDIEFKYNLELLWTFKCPAVKGRTVSAMCFNPSNENLLAVGYGKYFFQDRTYGLVCCWCIKNPTQPERAYVFHSPVTSLEFSREHPNLLAVGLYNGSLLILDISSKKKSIIAQNHRETSPALCPLWQVTWYKGDDYQHHDEQLMTASQDGRICRYRRSREFACTPMMRVTRMEGKVKGIDLPRKCRNQEIPVTCHPAALILARSPGDPVIYYVGTDEGGVHKCSTNYLHQHLDLFMAHYGPVYAVQFSPYCSKIFLTCGADWAVRIWAEGVGEPIITLIATMESVLGAVWSPTNATIIATISGNHIHVWDIRRKTFVTASTTKSPTNARNTTIQFSKSGENVIVGDIEGNVHVFNLKNMPFPPHFQENALGQAVEKALITRPEILKELKKFEGLFLD